jgi:hypothetical protein
MPIEEKRPTSSSARKPSDHLGAPGEIESRRHERLPSHRARGRFPKIDLRADIPEAIGEIPLERRLIARRITRKSCSRVETNELGSKSDEICAPRFDLLTNASFLRGQGHGESLQIGTTFVSTTGRPAIGKPSWDPGEPIAHFTYVRTRTRDAY